MQSHNSHVCRFCASRPSFRSFDQFCAHIRLAHPGAHNPIKEFHPSGSSSTSQKPNVDTVGDSLPKEEKLCTMTPQQSHDQRSVVMDEKLNRASIIGVYFIVLFGFSPCKLYNSKCVCFL